MKISDPFDVLGHAARFGVRYGAVLSTGPLASRSVINVSRPDREHTDIELESLLSLAERLHHLLEQDCSLTDAQVEALSLFGQGLDYDEMCKALGITRTALKARLSGARKHLGVGTNTEAVVIATQRRILAATAKPAPS